jgi:hypothetical protein
VRADAISLRNVCASISPSFVRDGDRAIIVLPAAQFRVRFLADFAPPIGTQYFDGVSGAKRGRTSD